MTRRLVAPGMILALVMALLVTTGAQAVLVTHQDFDGVSAPALPAGWTNVQLVASVPADDWMTSSAASVSAPNSAFTNNPDYRSDKALVSPSFAVTSAAAQVSFVHSYDSETNFDGGVLEVRLNGNNFYQDILVAGGTFVAGPYTGFAGALLGRAAWSGNSGGFITTTAQLPASYVGNFVTFRWRFASDSSVAGVGWFVDNVRVQDLTPAVFTSNRRNTPLPPIVFTGTLTASDPAMDTRVYREGIPSDCTTGQKAYPGDFGTGPIHYDLLSFTNGLADACVTVTFESTCGVNYFGAAYLGPFNPGDRAQAYAGDPGSSPDNGIPAGMTLLVPARATVTLLIMETTAGLGCAGYTVTVDGLSGNGGDAGRRRR